MMSDAEGELPLDEQGIWREMQRVLQLDEGVDKDGSTEGGPSDEDDCDLDSVASEGTSCYLPNYGPKTHSIHDLSSAYFRKLSEAYRVLYLSS